MLTLDELKAKASDMLLLPYKLGSRPSFSDSLKKSKRAVTNSVHAASTLSLRNAINQHTDAQQFLLAVHQIHKQIKLVKVGTLDSDLNRFFREILNTNLYDKNNDVATIAMIIEYCNKKSTAESETATETKEELFSDQYMGEFLVVDSTTKTNSQSYSYPEILHDTPEKFLLHCNVTHNKFNEFLFTLADSFQTMGVDLSNKNATQAALFNYFKEAISDEIVKKVDTIIDFLAAYSVAHSMFERTLKLISEQQFEAALNLLLSIGRTIAASFLPHFAGSLEIMAVTSAMFIKYKLTNPTQLDQFLQMIEAIENNIIDSDDNPLQLYGLFNVGGIHANLFTNFSLAAAIIKKNYFFTSTQSNTFVLQIKAAIFHFSVQDLIDFEESYEEIFRLLTQCQQKMSKICDLPQHYVNETLVAALQRFLFNCDGNKLKVIYKSLENLIGTLQRNSQDQTEIKKIQLLVATKLQSSKVELTPQEIEAETLSKQRLDQLKEQLCSILNLTRKEFLKSMIIRDKSTLSLHTKIRQLEPYINSKVLVPHKSARYCEALIDCFYFAYQQALTKKDPLSCNTMSFAILACLNALQQIQALEKLDSFNQTSSTSSGPSLA